jgi:hypothetical protein
MPSSTRSNAKRTRSNTNNSTQTSVRKRARSNAALPPVGSLIYRRYTYGTDANPYGEKIFSVTKHRGTTASAQEMLVVGRNANETVNFGNSIRTIRLIPHGIAPKGERVVVRPVSRGEWQDAQQRLYRRLLHGQHVISFIGVNTEKFNALRHKVAARKIQAAWKSYTNTYQARVLENPAVQNALISKYMVHLTGHGSIVPGKTFVVPKNVVIVFTTTPGALSFSSTYMPISASRVRNMILGKDKVYTVAYFAGDTVSDHTYEFTDAYSGLFQVQNRNVYSFAEYQAFPLNYAPNALGIPHTAWNQANAIRGGDPKARRLSSIVRYLAEVYAKIDHKPWEPLIIVADACRTCWSLNNLNQQVARNVAARHRVSGPGYTLPTELPNLKRIGMTPYLKTMYRGMKKNNNNRVLSNPEKHALNFINWMRHAGALNKTFTKR